MQLAYPYGFDAQGRTAQAAGDDHIRDLIEQVLFTAPGERVNRPTFGTGLAQLLFSPTSPELATATQFLVQGALQQWLGDLIKFTGVFQGLLLFTLLACDTLIAYRIRRKAAAKAATHTTSSLQASTPLTAPPARSTEGAL
jgi:hypothetical protein